MKYLRRVVVKIFVPDTVTTTGKVLAWQKPSVRTYRAPSRKYFTDENVQDLLEKLVDEIDGTFPDSEYRMVCVGEGAYSFVFDCFRASRLLPAGTPVVSPRVAPAP